VILDTNALSAMADGDEGIGAPLANATEIAIPVIALGEFRYGIRGSRSRARYERWLDELMNSCRVLDVSADTTVIYAEIREALKRSGRPIPANDAWIAALARQYGMPVVSRDRHFDFVAKLVRMSW
jgi:tRNA(fMet)-specific endonuclease VapC